MVVPCKRRLCNNCLLSRVMRHARAQSQVSSKLSAYAYPPAVACVMPGTLALTLYILWLHLQQKFCSPVHVNAEVFQQIRRVWVYLFGY